MNFPQISKWLREKNIKDTITQVKDRDRLLIKKEKQLKDREAEI
jgi:uncharacterized protein (DUF3084 family)